MILAFIALAALKAQTVLGSCNFAQQYECADFFDQSHIESYLDSVMLWESRFASTGIGYDTLSGYTYDGQMLDYETGELYGEPHLFSAPSKGERQPTSHSCVPLRYYYILIFI